MPAVATVTIGGKRIALEALTGDVVDTQRSPATGTDTERDRWARFSPAWHYREFAVRTAGGREWRVELERVTPVSRGQRVTLLRGIVGTKESNWLAIFNHTTGRLAYVAQTRNDLAGPAFYNLLTIVAVFVAVFGLFSVAGAFGESSLVALFWLLASAAYFVWVFQRRKKLTGAVEEAVKRLRAQPVDAAAS
jgi:hypothetical protein